MHAIFALAVLGMLAALPAQATTYDFIAISDVSRGARFPGPNNTFPTPATIGSLTIPDALVAAGSLTVTPCSVAEPCSLLPNFGWPAGVTGEIGLGDPARIPDKNYNVCGSSVLGSCPAELNVTFNPDGTLSGSIDLSGMT